MHIQFLNPFHGGSHAVVAEGYAAHSRHHVTLLPLSTAGGWRWRMRGAAVTLARRALDLPPPDLFVATDMLDLTTFLALYGKQRRPPPVALYFHENQLTYPLPAGRRQDLSFAWINYSSALAADALFFNSAFHRRSFFAALPGLPGRYYDHQELDLLPELEAKAAVLPPGIDLQFHARSAPAERAPGPARILWNSRWDYDKQPAAFFAALEELAACGPEFRLIIAGEHVDPQAAEFVAAHERWADRIEHWGFAENRAEYSRLLHLADIVVSTAIQEFFGIGIIEALSCGCVPILPRRLTYPELLPPELHAGCLYTDEADLVVRLAAAIEQLPEMQQRNWRAIAAMYDWSHMAPQYDAAFSAMVPE